MKYILIILSSMLFTASYAQQWGVTEHPRFVRTDRMHVVRQNVQADDIMTADVRSRSVDISISGILPSEVKPLLAKTNLWHQYELPYKRFTPVIEGQHCPTGCVALAMSQVMHYYRYPERGIGSNQYIDSLGCKETLYSDFSSHVYDWNNMLYEYDHTEYNDIQADAVARLQYDCGISVNMCYGKDASGAISVRQPIALVNNFGYDKGAQIYYRDFYTYDEMQMMLKNELANKRPVLISGTNMDNSHAFVIDGYNEDDEFHIMLGNPDGQADNWTTLENMTADDYNYGKGTPENGFNILQSFILGIQPKTKDSDANEHHLFVFRNISALIQKAGRNDSFTIATNDLCNVGCNLHEDSVSLMLVKNNQLVMPLYTYSHEFLLEEVDDTTYCDTLDIVFPKNITAGQYNIVPMYKDNGKWKEARTCIGTPNYLMADISNEGIILSSDTANTAYITLEGITVPDLMFNAYANDFSITLKAHNTEICGRVYVKLEALTEGGKDFYLQRHGITMKKNEEKCYHYSASKVWVHKLGKYRLHVYYESNLFTDELIELPLPNEVIIDFIDRSHIQIASSISPISTAVLN